jgi:flotillin
VRIQAEAAADAEAVRLRKVAFAQAESIQRVNAAIQVGGESYFRYRQIEMLPQIAPAIAQALAEAKLITIASGEGSAAESTTNSITSVIQAVLAAQLARGVLESSATSVAPPTPVALPAAVSPPTPVAVPEPITVPVASLVAPQPLVAANRNADPARDQRQRKRERRVFDDQ